LKVGLSSGFCFQPNSMIADKIIRYGSFLAPGIASLFPDRT